MKTPTTNTTWSRGSPKTDWSGYCDSLGTRSFDLSAVRLGCCSRGLPDRFAPFDWGTPTHGEAHECPRSIVASVYRCHYRHQLVVLGTAWKHDEHCLPAVFCLTGISGVIQRGLCARISKEKTVWFYSTAK